MRKNGRTVAVILLIIVTMGLIIGMRNAEVKRNYEYNETTIYYVEKGDTLWSIAKQYSDNRHDIREVIHEIEKLSDCTANIQPYDQLIIPLYEVMKNAN